MAAAQAKYPRTPFMKGCVVSRPAALVAGAVT